MPTPSAAPDLTDRVALITGAAGDIGIAIARAFIAAGARVALLDRDATALARAAAEHLPDDGQSMQIQADVASAEQTRRAVERVGERWGAVTLLVNNAAVVTAPAAIADIGEDDWRMALDVNLTGAWLMTKCCVPGMLQAGRGVILNVASQLGQVALAGRGAYGASKAGLLALTRATAVDYGAHGIRAVSLSPGAVITGRVLARYGNAAAAAQALSGKYPIGRLAHADEVAAAALFLASDAAGFITGNDLLVDGGYTAV